MKIPDSVKKELKEPLGILYPDVKKAMIPKEKRVVSIGDICTIELILQGIRPHLAVFDYRSKRKELGSEHLETLESAFPDPKRYSNLPGTLSSLLIKDAGQLIEKGGAVLIDGEEDLTALAFILGASGKDIIVYGQPDKGIVVVHPDEKMKKRIRMWLASASSLSHKV